MKTAYLKFTPALALLFALGACDNIAEDERLVDYDRPSVDRNILIYEFTGQHCMNCPSGAATIHDIMEANPGQIIPICVHPERTSFTFPPLGGIILTSEASTFLYKEMKPDAFPAISVDGEEAITYNASQWSKEVAESKKNYSSAPADIHLNPTYDMAAHKLSVEYSIDFNEYTTTPMLAQIYLVEDGIVGIQKTDPSFRRTMSTIMCSASPLTPTGESQSARLSRSVRVSPAPWSLSSTSNGSLPIVR